MKKSYKHLFGPVPSRRFKRSLGIDLTPFKTCSFDCVFCQLGKTTNHTLERKAYVNIDETLAELEHWLKSDGAADQITLAGSGEPTLHSEFGQIIQFIKKHSNIPVALLTNGSMLFLPEVRQAAAKADIVKMSLSAWDQKSLELINRPPSGYSFEQLIKGEELFRNEFSGKLYLEVFMLLGINDTCEIAQKISLIAQKFQPDHIQLNTCVRPTAEDFAQSASEEAMNRLKNLFKPVAEIIADYQATENRKIKISREAVFEMLQRRPCTAREIGEVFGMHPNEVSKYLGILLGSGSISSTMRKTEKYYFADKTG